MRCISVRVSSWRRGQFLLATLLFTTSALADPGRSDSAPETAPLRDPSTDAVVQVTWKDLARIVDRHPRLSAGRAMIDAARGGVTTAEAVPNPTLEGNAGSGVARTGGASRLEWGLAVTMPLGWLAQRGPRVDAARAEVEVAQAESEALRRDVILQLRTLFWNLVFVQDQVASLASLEEQSRVLVETVRKRVEQGEVRPVEATRVEIELQKVQSELEGARTSLGARQDALGLWLGMPAGKALVAVADLDAPIPAIERDAALARARSTHPGLATARARTRVLDAEVAAAKRGRVPSFSLTGSTAYELDRRAYGLGFAVDVPLWNWNTGPIAQAEARRVAGQKLAEATSLELATSVLEAQAACQAATATAARLRTNVVPRSETAAVTMEKTYQLGETTLLEVIDARRTLLDARRLYLGALAQAQIDCSRLDVLVGQDPQ